MSILTKAVCCSLLFFLAPFCFIEALCQNAQSPTDAERACRNFVRAFYTWYVPGHGVEDVLKSRRSALSPELVRMLKEDMEASAKSPDEIVGLDFDPFLNAQDVAERHEIGKATAKRDSFLVEVYGIWSGKKSEKPDVVAEVAFREGHWLFVNFHYGKTELPENENLLSVLKALKRERQKHHK